MQEFVAVMKALSDPNRVKIIKMLQRRVLCVCEIHEALGLAQSSASKHLRILEEAGLVTRCKEGLWVNFQLADGSQSPYAANLLGNLRHWLEQDAEIAVLMARLPEIKRENIYGRSPQPTISPYDELNETGDTKKPTGAAAKENE
jgi:ArsR family transcriptional regulator